MSKRYQIWDKQTAIITPVQQVFTAEEWMDEHPASRLIPTVCATGAVNGAFFDTLAQMVRVYTQAGADFSGAVTDEDMLDVIEAFEDAQNDPGDVTESTPEERTAAALEALVMGNMATVNDDDPDED